MKLAKIALATLLLLAIIYHASLWFFKTEPLQKHIEKITIDEKDHVSIGSFSTSILPFSHKVTAKNVVLKNNGLEAVFENIVIYPTAFSSAYVMKFPQAISLKDQTKKDFDYNLEFSADSKFTIGKGIKEEIFLLRYNGSGYKIIDNISKKNLIEAELKDAQTEINFGRNFFSYSNKSSAAKMLDKDNNLIFSNGPANIEVSFIEEGDLKHIIKCNINIKDLEYLGQKNSSKQQASAENFSVKSLPYDFNSGKIGFVLAGELVLTENKKTLPPQKGFSLQIQNFEFAHQQYKILLNAQVENTPESLNLPFGAATLQIENLDNIISSVILDRAQKFYANDAQKEEKMKIFHEVLNFYVSAIKNIAAKNSKTTATKLVFDIKKSRDDRDVKINESPFSEVMMQLMMMQDFKRAQPAVNEFSYPNINSIRR